MPEQSFRIEQYNHRVEGDDCKEERRRRLTKNCEGAPGAG